MRPIDADALIKDGGFLHEIDNAVYWEEEDIANAPTLTLDDIEPITVVVRPEDVRITLDDIVPHGRWIMDVDLVFSYEIDDYICEDHCTCSLCDYDSLYNTNYCPNCGAKMDLEEDDG
jgi:hypothetical protein